MSDGMSLDEDTVAYYVEACQVHDNEVGHHEVVRRAHVLEGRFHQEFLELYRSAISQLLRQMYRPWTRIGTLETAVRRTDGTVWTKNPLLAEWLVLLGQAIGVLEPARGVVVPESCSIEGLFPGAPPYFVYV